MSLAAYVAALSASVALLCLVIAFAIGATLERVLLAVVLVLTVLNWVAYAIGCQSHERRIGNLERRESRQ